MKKSKKDLTSETVVIKVNEDESKAADHSAEQAAPLASPTLDSTSDVNLTTKAQQEDKKFAGTLTYEDILSQTQELTDIKATDVNYLAEEAKLRREKIENLDEHLKDLNAQPLSSVDSYSDYNLVLNKSIWNYNEVEQRQTKLQVLDLALLTHIYIYDGVVIPLDEVQKTINNFLDAVQANVLSGYPVILNSSLIMDVLRFDKSKVIPITVTNPHLIPPMGVIDWQTFVPNEANNYLIIEAFIKILDNALNNGHECEFYPDTIMVRNASGVTSLFISEAAGVKFNSLAKSKGTPKASKK